MPPRNLGASYTNTDYTLTDDGDLLDMWRTFVVAKGKYEGAFDLAQIVDSRERRRIVGDFVISPLDLFNGRTYPDSIGYSYSNFDTHGFTVHPLFTLNPPDKTGVGGYTPYRALLPKGYEGLLVTGPAPTATPCRFCACSRTSRTRLRCGRGRGQPRRAFAVTRHRHQGAATPSRRNRMRA